MDPRLKALIEVRDLLEVEGWASARSVPGESVLAPERSSRSARQPLLAALCICSVLINVAFVATMHELRGQTLGRRSTIELVDLTFKASEFKSDLFLTIDGNEVWRRSPGPGNSVKLDFTRTKPVEFGSQCVVQLWKESQPRPGARPELLAQTFVTPDQAKRGVLQIHLQTGDDSFYRWTARIAESRPAHSR